ncbi:MAG: hypothetical protein AAFP92_02640, partial [Bacteroidota bacterium]
GLFIQKGAYLHLAPHVQKLLAPHTFSPTYRPYPLVKELHQQFSFLLSVLEQRPPTEAAPESETMTALLQQVGLEIWPACFDWSQSAKASICLENNLEVFARKRDHFLQIVEDFAQELSSLQQLLFETEWFALETNPLFIRLWNQALEACESCQGFFRRWSQELLLLEPSQAHLATWQELLRLYAVTQPLIHQEKSQAGDWFHPVAHPAKQELIGPRQTPPASRPFPKDQPGLSSEPGISLEEIFAAFQAQGKDLFSFLQASSFTQHLSPAELIYLFTSLVDIYRDQLSISPASLPFQGLKVAHISLASS